MGSAPGDGVRYRRAMVEFEQRTTVPIGADAALDLLADPVRLSGAVPPVEWLDVDVVDGDTDLDADVAGRDGAPEERFFVDRQARRIEWGEPDGDYGGSIEVGSMMASLSTVTVRLRTRDDADPAAVQRVVDETVQNLRRTLSGR